jgi:hypothetical protein
VTSPPEGLYNGRFASSSFLNDGQLELLNQFDTLGRERDWLEKARAARKSSQRGGDEAPRPAKSYREANLLVVNFELDQPASLSWYLTENEKERIQGKTEALRDQIADLLEWWKNPVAAH